MYADSCEQVLQMEFLLGKIHERIKGSETFLHARQVNSFWRRTTRIPAVISGFMRHNRPCFIGFMCEHDRGYGTELKLINPLTTPMADPARVMRERFIADGLYGKYMLGTYGSRVICRIESGTRHGRMYINSPCSTTPRTFTSVGSPVPAMEKNPRNNTYGWFAMLEPTNGPTRGFPVFFVKDASRGYGHDHLGVKFSTAGRVCVHVCVFNKGRWSPHISDPLTPPSSGIFQRSPYCVQAGPRLYMMYLLDLIVCFDVEQETFGVVHLPGQMEKTVKGCLQYTAGPHPEGDLVVIHLDGLWLVRWVLTRKGDMADWNEEARVDLVAAFGHLMNRAILDAFSVQPSEWRAIQLRSVSPDGQYVLISVGILHGLFMVDMSDETVEAVPNLHKMGRVFPLSRYWPSKP